MSDSELTDLAQRLQGVCLGRALTVATAESCTGGLLASVLTDVPGASGYVLGGIVAYADAVKVALLDVPEALLEAHGAVSAHVARAMAVGVRRRFGADLAVSVTGIAGPDGGTPSKPVGLAYLAVAGPTGPEVRRFVWTGDREQNKRASVKAGLELLLAAADSPAPATAGTG